MGERLTDEQMASLERIVVGDDGVRPIMFPWMAKALEEIRERRAQDSAQFDAAVAVMPDDGGKVRRVFLSGREVEALDDIARAIAGSVAKTERVFGDALVVLQKLTRGNR